MHWDPKKNIFIAFFFIISLQSTSSQLVPLFHILPRRFPFEPKVFIRVRLTSLLTCLSKSFGSVMISSYRMFGTMFFRIFVCLLCSPRRCRPRCTCLLDWNAHAHQHCMRENWSHWTGPNCTLFLLHFFTQLYTCSWFVPEGISILVDLIPIVVLRGICFQQF